jgi:hypothetical protein
VPIQIAELVVSCGPLESEDAAKHGREPTDPEFSQIVTDTMKSNARGVISSSRDRGICQREFDRLC